MLLTPIALALAAATAPMSIDVDARDIGRRVVHTRLVIPASPGKLTLSYPKWIPGAHRPSGPLNGVINLHVAAGGKELAWQRDPVEMYAFHVEVPAGASVVEASFDFVADGESYAGFSDRTAVLEPNTVVLVPGNARPDDLRARMRLTLPSGWDFGSGMKATKRTGDLVEFEELSLTMVIDSPVAMGRYSRRVALGEGHSIFLVADSPGALEVPADTVTQWKQLVAETGAMFGSRHYRHYEFLLTLSDTLRPSGLEHHESSRNGLPERALIDDDKRPLLGDLLPHELAHSWNGKFRRPAGLATGDYLTPMKDELLWVYEGLTTYLGWVLAARSGIQIEEEWAGEQAMYFASFGRSGGRSWRSLEDTAVAAPALYEAARAWSDARRSVDFYEEGTVLWLAADLKIRELSQGKKSLDDFLRAFFGGPGGKAEVKPYTFDELVSALNAVAPYDWRGFWRRALEAKNSSAVDDALAAAGWRIELVEEAPGIFRGWEGLRKRRDLSSSLGFKLGAEDGSVVDVTVGSPAWKAGVTPGMKLVAVNGRRDSPEVLAAALLAARKDTAPIELLLENDGFFRTVQVDYHQGPRFPVLSRVPKKPDLLAKILAPRTPHAKRTEKDKGKK
ncbi:MAG: M61 family metallopeptidase [Deltaproteobacteria bacterium]|nr:M61 family metallopeptidase [Deltaproteobacteria bacterium]